MQNARIVEIIGFTNEQTVEIHRIVKSALLRLGFDRNTVVVLHSEESTVAYDTFSGRTCRHEGEKLTCYTVPRRFPFIRVASTNPEEISSIVATLKECDVGVNVVTVLLQGFHSEEEMGTGKEWRSKIPVGLETT